MTRFFATTLGEVYDTLELLPKPIAVFDFLSGEVGYETLCSQSIAHKFHCKCDVPVVALCWHGCSILYQNVSEHQIEFVDDDIAMRGNKIHRGEPRYEWLVSQNHKERVDSIQGIIAHEGPMYWTGGSVLLERLRPDEYREYLSPIQTTFFGLYEYIIDAYKESKPVFESSYPPITDSSYIAFFDRNERHQPERNVQGYHIHMMIRLAQEYGYQLVVVSGLYPRNIGDAVIQLRPKHRDLDLLCRVAQDAVLFCGSPSGASEAAMLFGCNFALLGDTPPVASSLYRKALESRGYRYFGEITSGNDATITEVEKYLWQRQRT